MKNKWTKKVVLLLSLAVLVLGVSACGGKKGSVDEQAVTRSQDADPAVKFIDDAAIALAQQGVPTDTAQQIANSLALVNANRTAAGRSALAWNDGLAQCAQVRAMEASQVFSHTRPNGQDWWTVNSNLMWGENLAMLYNSADSVVAAWMASPTHQANIMNGSFRSVGVAVYQDAGGNWYWAQEFSY